MLEQAREQNHMSMSQIITREIEDMSDGTDSLEYEHGGNVSSCTKHDAIRMTRFVKQLRKKKIWPRDGSATSASLSNQGAVDELIKFQEPAPAKNLKDCRACKTNLGNIVKIIADEVIREAKGICLDCVKATDPSARGQCQIKH